MNLKGEVKRERQLRLCLFLTAKKYILFLVIWVTGNIGASARQAWRRQRVVRVGAK